MDWGDVILVAVSGLVGVVGAVIGAIANNHFSRQQMREVWAEEERRRKSDRRRELYERDLKIVGDSVLVIERAMGALVWGGEKKGLVVNLIREAFLMQANALIVATSLGDEQLQISYLELSGGFGRWLSLIDTETGKPKEGEEEVCGETAEQAHRAAVKVLCRIREILEEV